MEELEVDIRRVDPEVIDCLIAYGWPGNVRELQQVVEQMVNMAAAGYIGIEHVPDKVLLSSESRIISQLSDSGFSGAKPATFEQHRARIQRCAQHRQKEELLRILEKHDGNITRAAEEMGVSRNTIYRRMKKLDLRR
jgi:transcriptional regulator of acetoin/glycerol metabolism